MINRNKLQEISGSVTQWQLVLLFLFPALPEWRINFVFIVFCALVLFSVSFIKPLFFWPLLKKNIIIAVPFIPYLVEYITHNNNHIAGFELEKKLLFFTAPVAFALYSAMYKWKPARVYMNAFVIALLLLSVYSIIGLLFNNMLFSDTALDNGARLLRRGFTEIAHTHPTYYGLFVNTAVLWMVYDYRCNSVRWKVLYILSAIVFLFLDLMLAPKMPLIALGTAFVCLLYKTEKDKRALWVKYFLIVVFYLGVPFIAPSVKNRLMDAKSIFRSIPGKTDERLIIFNCGEDVFKDNIWLGVGSRNDQSALDACYTSKGFTQDRQTMYNAHNQFLTLGINYGIIIMLLFVLALVWFMYKTKNNPLALAFMISTAMVMLTESVLERQWGVYFFVLFYIMFYNMPSEAKYE